VGLCVTWLSQIAEEESNAKDVAQRAEMVARKGGEDAAVALRRVGGQADEQQALRAVMRDLGLLAADAAFDAEQDAEQRRANIQALRVEQVRPCAAALSALLLCCDGTPCSTLLIACTSGCVCRCRC
jgi:hypothetical protein